MCILVHKWQKVERQFDNLEGCAAIRLGFATHSSLVLFFGNVVYCVVLFFVERFELSLTTTISHTIGEK